MSALDAAVWAQFLNWGGTDGWVASYDVTVGEGCRCAAEAADADELAYRTLLRKRIDVVLTRQGQSLVIEVKPLGGMAALGQVLTYRALLWSRTAAGISIAAAVVCGEVDEDVRPVFAACRVGVWSSSAAAWVVPLPGPV